MRQRKTVLRLAACFCVLFLTASCSCRVSFAETEDGGQSDTEDISEDVTKTECFTEDGTQTAKTHLDVDVHHCYPYMDQSYEQGYIPRTEKHTVYLVVPFVADGPLKEDRLTAEVLMEKNAPFVYANYRKELKKETYQFEERVDAYVLCCEIRLEEKPAGGKYPVLIRAHGYSPNGARAEYSGRIFITVSDKANTAPQPPAKEPATEAPEKEPVTEAPEKEPATEPPAKEPAAEPAAKKPAKKTSGGAAGGTAFSGNVTEGYSGFAGGGYKDSSSGRETEKIRRQPKLMITQDPLSGAHLLAGREREFVLCMQNMNAEETIYNLMVDVRPSQELWTGTSACYFGKVYPQETIAIPISLSAAADAAAGRGTLTLAFEYENAEGTAYSKEEELSLEIDQPAQAVLDSFRIAPQVYAQETVEAAVSVRNIGKAEIYNAAVELEAQGLTATGSMFAGNLEAGASYEGSMRIYVGDGTADVSAADGTTGSHYGPVHGTLTLTYEDADGTVCRQTQKFSTTVLEPQIVELNMETEEPQTNQWWAASLVLLALLFLMIVCHLAWHLRKSRNVLADLLAEKEEKRV